jgi:hypothetical protein
VAFQQDPDRFSTDRRNKFAAYNLLGQQSNRPTCPPLRRRRADNGDDALLLFEVQGGSLARSSRIEQRPLQASLLIPFADLPHSLGGKHQIRADGWRRLPLVQLKQRQSVFYRTHRLQSTAQQLLQMLPVFRG